ncbi:MAG: CBS domain-containing protein [Candidatus Binatia bacterium]
MGKTSIRKRSHRPLTRNKNRTGGKRIRVADVMTSHVANLKPSDSFDQAVSLIANRHFHHFVVVNEAGRISGVVSDRDILRAVTRTANWQTKSVGEIMTREPLTVSPETPVYDAIAHMLSKRINSLPVVDDSGVVCGIVTSTDFLKSYYKLLESLDK